MDLSATERAELAELFLQLGPDAPTLCEGWATRDLAVHLYVREHRPDAAAGMFVKPARPYLEKVSAQIQASKTYVEVVNLWAQGPAKFNPMRLTDRYVNVGEHFVHHEDVRRAQDHWQPRAFGQQERAAFYRVLQVMSRVLLSASIPLVLSPEGFDRIVVGEKRGVADPARSVQVMGSVPELLLWVYNRPAVGVQIVGDDSMIKRRSI